MTKHISFKCKCKFDDRKCNSNQKWNNDKYRCECENLKEHHVCKKYHIWNPAANYSASIIDDSVVKCDKIIDTTRTVPTKTVPANFNEKV